MRLKRSFCRPRGLQKAPLLVTLGLLVLFWLTERALQEKSVNSKSVILLGNIQSQVVNKTYTVCVGNATSSAPIPAPTKQAQKDASCKPKNQLVYLKTHKTGSSTVTTILQRYGHRLDLNFAMPKTGNVFSKYKFNAKEVYFPRLNGTDFGRIPGGFHILANHARFNRTAMAKLVPNATYFTIIRHPVAQFESAFSYFGMDREILRNNDRSMNPLETFLRDPERHHAVSTVARKMFAKNGQIYGLGLDEFQDPETVRQKIKSLSSEMDLVMINEYFDESLILLKKLLCWEFDDIMYIPKGVRSQSVHRNVTADLKAKIEKWNHADVELYQHFNQTLWERVGRYGPNFQRDLERFRRLKTATTDRCLANAKVRWDGHRASTFWLPPTSSRDCQDLVRDDIPWVSILRRRLAEKSDEFWKRKERK